MDGVKEGFGNEKKGVLEGSRSNQIFEEERLGFIGNRVNQGIK